MAITSGDVTIYTFSVTVTVPMDNDGDGTPDYATSSAKDIERQLRAALRTLDGDTDYELMETEVKAS